MSFFFFFSFFSFFQLCLASKGGIHTAIHGSAKREGEGRRGKRERSLQGLHSLQVAGGGVGEQGGLGRWDGDFTHSRTRTHSSQRAGRRQVGKGAKFLQNQCPAINASKQSRGEGKKNAGEGRGDAKLPFPLSSSAGGEKVSPDAASCWEAWYEAKLCFDRLCSTLPLSSSKICKGKKSGKKKAKKRQKEKKKKKRKVFCKVGVFCCKGCRGAVKNRGKGEEKKEN